MNTNKILSNVLMGGLLLVLFIPLVVSDSLFFPFITGKNFAFRIIIEILLGVWIVLAYRDPAYRPMKSPLLIAAASFVGILAIAGMLGENPHKSFWSNYERMEGVVSLLHFFAYFVMATTVLGVKGKWNTFWNTSIFVSFLIGVYALFQMGGAFDIHQGSTRVDATFGNSAYLAVYLLFHIFITLFMMLRAKGQSIGGMITEKASVWMYSPLIALDVFVLYYTATRGTILGLIGGLLLMALLIAIFEKNRPVLRKIAIGLLVGITLLVGGFFAMKDTRMVTESPVLSRFSSISLTEQTTKSRFMIWNMAYQGFKERPILGWGQENFNFVFNKYYDPNMYGQEPWFDRAHNVFFDWLIAGGVLGLLAYLALFGGALWYLWRRGSMFSVIEKSIFTGLLAGYFFQNFFVFDNLMSYVMFFSVLAFLESSRKGKPAEGASRKKEITSEESLPLDIAVAPMAIVLVLCSLYFVNAKALSANMMLIEALKPQQAGPMQNLENFKKVFAYDSFGSAEGREQLVQVTMSVLGAEKIDNTVKQSFVDLTLSEMKEQIDRQPNDARYQFFLGAFFSRLAQYNPASFDEAVVYLTKAHELSPQKQAILFELGSVYYNKKDLAKAEEMFRKAYELAPEYIDAENFYVRMLMEGEKYDEVNRVLEAHIKRIPDDADAHVKLSALYFEMGRRAEAVAEIRRAIEIDPAFAEQGAGYIREIEAGRRP
ncbi:MAG: O-antigen ligase family protein [Minisyncoccota bacterium]